MKSEKILSRITNLIERTEEVFSKQRSDRHHEGEVDLRGFNEIRTASLSFLQAIFGTEHTYFKDFEEKVVANHKGCIEESLGILEAVKNEIESGWLQSFKGIVSAEIFSDFLEMAKYLISENFKDAGAVIIGGVLEEHLRQLCDKNGIETDVVNGGVSRPKKANMLNADLSKAGVYNKLDQKNVIAWLDLRNKAAHGKYSEYNSSQVEQLLNSVMEFIVRNPS